MNNVFRTIELDEQQKREVRAFGVTEQGMREAVESRLARRYMTPAKMVAGMLSDAQEELEFDVDAARQTINRAKWIIFEYMDQEAA